MFNEPVTVAHGGLVVVDAAGRSVPLDQVGTDRGSTAVTGRLPEFAATEPYSSGVARRWSRCRRQERLALGFPAEGRYAELVLDGQDRLVEEVLVDAKHPTRRRFVYASHTEE